MNVELINTGSELMLGRTLNTHQQWLCRKLADLGLVVSRQVAIPDSAAEITGAVREALARADLVITTGGLGPTSDDLTRPALARLLGKPLREDAAVLTDIQQFFATRNRPLPEQARRQALVPEGSRILQNRHGTAPGSISEVDARPFGSTSGRCWLVMLPGPGRELRPMFTESLVPFLVDQFPEAAGAFACRVLRSTGLAESLVEERLGDSLRTQLEEGLDLGFCARPGRVDVRLAATGPSAQGLVAEAEGIVRAQLGLVIFGTGDEELEDVVLRTLADRRETLALAESCTGGYVAHLLTNVPGASAVLRAGLVTYSDDSKRDLLGVRRETLHRHGAVSEPAAREMAEGVRQRLQTDYAIAITGIAGPTGGTAEKPVGTVFLAVASARATRVQRLFNPWDRITFKEVTALQALDLLRLLLQTPV